MAKYQCPECGSTDVHEVTSFDDEIMMGVCADCNKTRPLKPAPAD